MSLLKPSFSLTIGGLKSTTGNPVGGPTDLRVERDMDIPADALAVHVMDRSGIKPGDAASVDLGHDGEEETVFTGTVVAVFPSIKGVRIWAVGKMRALLDFRTAAVYEGQAAGAIANDLIAQAGLSAKTVDDGPTLPSYAIDRRLSAFAHLKQLADRLGYELYGDRDGNVMFHALGDAAGLDAAAGGLLGAAAALLGGGGEGYAFGKHLLAASARQQALAAATVTVGGESPMSGQGDATAHWLTTQDADYRGSAGDGPPLLVVDPAARTKDLADRFAAGYLAARERQARQISFTVLGRPGVDLGDALSTRDAPDALVNGGGYVRAIRHRFSSGGGFVTDFRIAVGGGA